MKAQFYPDKNTVLLEIDKSATGLELFQNSVEEYGFVERDVIHATIVGFTLGLKIKTLLQNNPDRETIVKKIESLVAETDWTIGYTNEFFVISKDYEFFDKIAKLKVKTTRQTIIQKIVLPELESFYQKLNAITGFDSPVQFPHITLYTRGDEASKAGIGINSYEEFESSLHEKIAI